MDQAETLRKIMLDPARQTPAPDRAAKIVAIAGELPLAARLVRALRGQGCKAALDPLEPAEIVLLDCGLEIDGPSLSRYRPGFETVLAVRPGAFDRFIALIRALRSRVGIMRASVIVNPVTDGRAGRETFQKLKEVADRSLDMKLDYLGHCEGLDKTNENIGSAVINRGFLLNLGEDHRTGPSLELVAKRLRTKCLEMGEVTA